MINNLWWSTESGKRPVPVTKLLSKRQNKKLSVVIVGANLKNKKKICFFEILKFLILNF
jgi:hypothetical protein